MKNRHVSTINQRPDAISVIIPSIKNEVETVKSLPTCPVPHEVIIIRNHGIGHARNCGAQKASHPLLIFMDDDLSFNEALWPYLLKTKPNQVRMANINKRPCSRVLAVHKADFLKIGGFDDSITLSGEDTDFQLRAEDKGFTISIIPHRLIHHNDHESRFHGFNGIRKEVENARLFIRYGRRYGPYRRRFISSNIKHLQVLRLDLLLVKFVAFIYNILKRCFHLL